MPFPCGPIAIRLNVDLDDRCQDKVTEDFGFYAVPDRGDFTERQTSAIAQ